MGCCVSTNNKSPSPKNRSSLKSNRSPPPQSLPLLEIEEETVKEVLSETPAIKPKIPQNPSNIRDENNNIVHKKPAIINSFDVPNVSEFCSTLNQRISPANGDVLEFCSHFDQRISPAVIGSAGDSDVRRRVERSPGKSRARSISGDLKNERVMCKSPARRPEPSPIRVGSTSWRERRGDAGESSGRRTMSPVRYTNGGSSTRFDLSRSPSVRKTGRSPGRVRSDLPERNRKVEESKWPPTANESLENPLVSLECFIFL